MEKNDQLKVNEEDLSPSQIYVTGIKLMRNQEFGQAKQYLEKWIEFRGEQADPGDFRNMGWCCINLEEYPEAHTHYKHAHTLYLRVEEDLDGYLERRIQDCSNRLRELQDLMEVGEAEGVSL